MKLVLAEKPSVAMSLSKVIGADQRGDGYMEGNGYLVSWCVGHLVELSQPEAYDEKYAKWKYDDLPILPEHWQYQVSASTKKQFGILKKLMQRKDVESLICATDAGREGELIFRLVYHQCGCKKPVERLWISSMEDSAIREGFQKLRPGTEYDALYEAALCRERADWIVGINATRLFSCLYGQTLNVGRVMTPTLAMVVMRDAAIRAFKPEPFYSAELKFRDFQAGGERMKAKADAQPGSYSVGLENVTAKDTTGVSADLTSTAITVKVNERPITGEVTYLSDIDWKYAQSGWESVMKNQYCNGAASGAISLSVDGEQTYFSKGLGANADATVEYDVSSYKAQLEENEKLYFQAYVGIDYFKTAKKQNGDGVYFVIYDGEVDADGNIQGTEIYRSAKLDSYSDAEHISIDISGIQKNLVLFMDKIGNNAHDNGDWADTKLIHVPDPNAADKVELKQTLDIAKALKEADYTVESYKALQKALADAQAVYADKKATQEAVNAQAAALQAAVQGLKVPDAADYQEVLKKLQNKENELTQKDEELKTANAKVTELQSELKTAQDDLKKLQDSVDAKESEIAAKEAEITKLNGELASAKEEVSTLKKEKTDLEKSVNDYRARILELEAAAKKQKEESDAAYKKLQEEKEAAEAALKQAQAEIERLKAQQNQEEPKPEETLKVGDSVTSGNVKYRVTDAQKKLAEAYGVDSRRARTLKVAAAVTISGEKVSVTSIAANAFKGMKKLEKVTVGTNVSKIGKNAFSGDSKLKNIQIKSKKLTSVGKKALKNISAKAVIKVPKKKQSAYKKILKARGVTKKEKVQAIKVKLKKA